jgi:predicted MFS family arabinose efflux permease
VNPADAPSDQFSRPSARFTFGLLFLLYLFDYIDRMVVVSLFPFLKADWGLSDAECGLLVSAVYWSILVFSLPVSVLIDRWSRKKCIGMMALLWSAASLACAFVRGFPHLLAARTAIGVGEAGYAPGGTAMIAALFPGARRARMLGIWNASIPLGSAIGIALGGFIAQHWGWRHAFGVVAAPGLLLALSFFWVRDYRTVALAGAAGNGLTEPLGWREAARMFARNRTLMFNNLGFAANVFVTTALLTWLPTYFHRLQGLPMDRAGTKAATVMLLAIVGAPLGGYLADRWFMRRKTARLLFPALSSLATGLMLFLAFTLARGALQYIALLCCGVTAVAFVPAAVAVTQDVVHPGLRAVSLSLNVIIQHLLGSAVAPAAIGALSDAWGLEAALLALPVFTLAAAALFLAASRFYEQDAARVEKIQVRMEEPGGSV